jgi:hypothetical protein
MLCYVMLTNEIYLMLLDTYIYRNMYVVLKVMSNFFLHAAWEQQMKESMVVGGTSYCVNFECLVTSVECIT